MSEDRKAAQKVFREWCAEHGLALSPDIAADLVNRIARAIRESQS